MNWYLDVFSDDCADDFTCAALAAIQQIEQSDQRSGVCEDDVEACCPYIDILPDESYKENGSPLRFR